MHVVEEQVGKKRRKEVRQAISMSEQMRGNLIFFFVALVVLVIASLVFYFLSSSGMLQIDAGLYLPISMGLLIVVMIIVTPKINRYWALRDELKQHCRRYNISKEDMRALKNGEL